MKFHTSRFLHKRWLNLAQFQNGSLLLQILLKLVYLDFFLRFLKLFIKKSTDKNNHDIICSILKKYLCDLHFTTICI